MLRDTSDRRATDGLRAVGITTAEEAAYELLIGCRRATLSQIAAGWTRPEDLPETLAALECRGLVCQLLGNPPRYDAVPPDVALAGLLLDREQQLRQARGDVDRLITRYREHAPEPGQGMTVETVHGTRAAQQRLAQLQRGTRDQLRCLDKPPYLDYHGTGEVELALLRRGVSSRVIYDRDSVELPQALPGIEELIQAGQQARVLPGLPVKLYLVDDRLGVLPLGGGSALEGILIIHPCALLDALAILFEGLWQRALPLDLTVCGTPSQPLAAGDGRAVADDRRLVALLLSGLTDRVIARQLGVGYRTVQRRIAALMAELGIQTRFQAGAQTALREAAAASKRDVHRET